MLCEGQICPSWRKGARVRVGVLKRSYQRATKRVRAQGRLEGLFDLLRGRTAASNHEIGDRPRERRGLASANAAVRGVGLLRIDVIGRFFISLRRGDGQALILAAAAFPMVLVFLAFAVDAAHAFVDKHQCVSAKLPAGRGTAVIRRFFVSLRRGDGQALILMAAAFPMVLVFLAFAVDAAHAFVDQKHLQNTADAAALGGVAADLGVRCTYPAPSTCIDPTVTEYVDYNNNDGIQSTGLVACNDANPSSTPNCYEWPWLDPSCTVVGGVRQCVDKVMVKLEQCTPTFFGGVVGVPSICTSVSSVASETYLTHENDLRSSDQRLRDDDYERGINESTELHTHGNDASNAGYDYSQQHALTRRRFPAVVALRSSRATLHAAPASRSRVTSSTKFTGGIYSDGGINLSKAYTFGGAGSYNTDDPRSHQEPTQAACRRTIWERRRIRVPGTPV